MILNTKFSDIEKLYQSLDNHPVFNTLSNIENLQSFMSWHVFAVWDFMSLTKRLQRELTCVDLPWTPPIYPHAARLINDIVLGEESDDMPDGCHLSHYEMYLIAMEEIGADTSQVKKFVELVSSGVDVDKALIKVNAHPGIQDFVNHTIKIAMTGNVYQVLGNFFFSRENVIPMMFKSLLERWQIDESMAPMFVYYLKRHIELDADSHGPAVWKIINEITEANPESIGELKEAASIATQARVNLWDGLLQQFSTEHLQHAS
jgi:hypothetical protein